MVLDSWKMPLQRWTVKDFVCMADFFGTYSPGSDGNRQGSFSIVNIQCPSYDHVLTSVSQVMVLLWGCRVIEKWSLLIEAGL